MPPPPQRKRKLSQEEEAAGVEEAESQVSEILSVLRLKLQCTKLPRVVEIELETTVNRVISVKSTELFKVKITVNRVISVRIYSVQRLLEVPFR